LDNTEFMERPSKGAQAMLYVSRLISNYHGEGDFGHSWRLP
jgi:hypothetical protein